jgi:ABC-2 type transport system permease protein
MPSNPVSIKVEHLTRVYQTADRAGKTVTANDNLTFEVRRGEIFGLLGPNGAGKTTLVSQMLGLIKPTSGSIWVEGIDVVREPDRVKALVGFLPQTGIPLRFAEVERALNYTGRLRGQTAQDAKAQARELIDQLGMGEHAKRYVNKLSGGMLRLVNFGMALMGRPKVLFLDEPTNELDPHNRRLVWDTIARLNHEQGVTCVLVTHHVLEAESVMQRVGVMQHGQMCALGTPGELKQAYSGKVRFEFSLKEDDHFSADELARIAALGEVEHGRRGIFRLYLPYDGVAAATDTLVNGIGLARLNDFRLAPPSLEDVYLDLNMPSVDPEEDAIEGVQVA